MPTIPLGGESYQDASKPISAQVCNNLYASIPETTSTTKLYLQNTPGIDLLMDNIAGDSGICRGGGIVSTVQEDTTFGFWVVGTRLVHARFVKSLEQFSATGAGSLPGTKRIMMAANSAQLCVIIPESSDVINAYIADLTAQTPNQTVAVVTDVGFDGPVQSLAYSDGYFVFVKKNSRKFFVSELNDGTSYDSTKNASFEADGGNAVGCYVMGDILYVFGVERGQAYQNIGGSGFPFQKIPGASFNKGLISPYAIADINGVIFFCGQGKNERPRIFVTDGGEPQRVSNPGIEDTIAGYDQSVLDQTCAWTYSEDDEEFVVFCFPDKKVFVYGVRSKLWHERNSFDSISGEVVPWRADTALKISNKLIVADTIEDKVGYLDKTIYTEYGQDNVRQFVTPNLDNDGQPFWVDALELVCESGYSGDTDALISMDFSTDGGHTFSEPMERAVGKTGQYNKRVIWNSLGRIEREICFRFSMSAGVKWVFRKLEAQFE